MKNKKFWQVRASADPKSADLLLYGYISNSKWFDDDVTPKEFAKDLADLGEIEVLNVYINSYGGDAWSAQAIYSQLKRFQAKANVHVHIDGIAASAASFVAMAGETIHMPSNALIMIHNPWTVGVGDVHDFEKVIDMLNKTRETMVAVYTEKTGLSDDEIIKLLDEETWMTAEEAHKYGFADVIEDSAQLNIAACLSKKTLMIGQEEFDISHFKRFPYDRVPAASLPKQTEPKEPSQSTDSKQSTEVTNVELTLEVLAEKYPDIYNAVKKAGHEEGVKAERDRMKAIDEIAIAGAEEIVKKAKYETGISAEQVAIEIIKAEKARGAKYLADVKSDANDINDVKADAHLPEDKKEITSKQKAAFARGANK